MKIGSSSWSFRFVGCVKLVPFARFTLYGTLVEWLMVLLSASFGFIIGGFVLIKKNVVADGEAPQLTIMVTKDFFSMGCLFSLSAHKCK